MKYEAKCLFTIKTSHFMIHTFFFTGLYNLAKYIYVFLIFQVKTDQKTLHLSKEDIFCLVTIKM